MSDQFLDVDEEPPVEEVGVESILNQLLDLLAVAKSMPLSSSVMVSREEVSSLVQSAIECLPDELRQARWLLREREEFMAERNRDAEALMDDVRAQAEHMVQRTEIVRQANSVAQRILDDANEEARRLRHEAEDYADQKLASFEIVLDRTMKTVQAGREKLQVVPIPNVEIGDRGDTTVAASTLGEEGQHLDEPEGFFDQDSD